jgi:hypothetical protein
MAMVEAAPAPDDKIDLVAAYKGILRDVLDRRPSGTRQRLADALKRNRSFITQIANPAYAIPVPARHVATIFEICHFSPVERVAFMEAYHRAHPRSLVEVSNRARGRHAHLVLPDFGSDEKNHTFDELLDTFITGVARLVTAKSDGKSDGKGDSKDKGGGQ